MPDYFVPLDTTLNSHYLNELYTSRAIYEYTFKYAERNKETLEEKGFESFLNAFTVTDAMLNDLAREGEHHKVKTDKQELKEKKRLFQIHVKAQIARKIWGNKGFYPVWNETNEVFVEAIKLLDKMPESDRNKM
jgi:carboxyl-terminal processing protease